MADRLWRESREIPMIAESVRGGPWLAGCFPFSTSFLRDVRSGKDGAGSLPVVQLKSARVNNASERSLTWIRLPEGNRR